MQAGGVFPPLILEGQQGGVLEGEHGKAAGQSIVQGDAGVAGPVVGNPGEIIPNSGDEGVEVQVFTLADFILTTVGELLLANNLVDVHRELLVGC